MPATSSGLCTSWMWLGRLAGGALDLLVALVADQQDVVVVGGEALRLVVHLGDQRAGGVDRLQAALGGLLVHHRGDAVGGEHDGRALGHLVELLDEDRAAGLQVGHHVLVVHDLLAHVDRRAVEVERLLDGDHGPVDARRSSRAARRGARRGRPRRARGRAAYPGRVMAPIVGAGHLGSPTWPWRPPRSIRRRCARSPRRSASGSTGSGAVWVEGQVTQISRRGGMNTVFLTLRDKLADVSVPGHLHRGGHRLAAHPAGRGRADRLPRQAVVLPQPRHPLAARPRDPAGRRGRAARPARAPPPAARRRGPLRRRSSSARCRSCPATSAWSPPRTRPPSATSSRTPGGAGPASSFTVEYAAMQGMQRRPRGDRGRSQALDRDPEVDVIVIARGGGSVEDLLPFSDEALVRAVLAATHPGRLRDRARARLPVLDLVADVRASTPTDAAKRVVPDVAEEAQRVLQVRERGRMAHPRPGRARAARSSTRSGQRPGARRPAQRASAERRPRSRATASAPAARFRHRLDRADDDLGHQLARVRALSPLATLRRGYAVLSDADGQALSSVADPRARAATCTSGSPTAGSAPPRPRSTGST